MQIYIRRIETFEGTWFDIGEIRFGIFYSTISPLVVDYRALLLLKKKGLTIMDYDACVLDMARNN